MAKKGHIVSKEAREKMRLAWINGTRSDASRRRDPDDIQWNCIDCGKRKSSFHAKRCDECNRKYIVDLMNNKQREYNATAARCKDCGHKLYKNGNCRSCSQRGVKVPSRGNVAPEKKSKLYKGRSKRMLGNKHLQGYSHPQSWWDKAKKWLIKPNGETSIERKIRKFLQREGIYFEQEKKFEEVGFVDFYLVDHRIVVECDGTYWHNSEKIKENDNRRDKILTSMGINVLRLTETEIKKDFGKCIAKITKAIRR